MEEELYLNFDKREKVKQRPVRTALHIVVVALRTELVEVGKCREACSLELGQGDFSVFVLVDGIENGIDDYLGLPLMLFVVLYVAKQLARDIRGERSQLPLISSASIRGGRHISPRLPLHPILHP